jgi:hypothetical protein
MAEKIYASDVSQKNLSHLAAVNGSYACRDRHGFADRDRLGLPLEKEFKVWRLRKSRLKALGVNPIQKGGQSAVDL